MISRAARRAYERVIERGGLDDAACLAALVVEQSRYIERTSFWRQRLYESSTATGPLDPADLDAAEWDERVTPYDGEPLTLVLPPRVLVTLYHTARAARSRALSDKRKAEKEGSGLWRAHRDTARHLTDAIEVIEDTLERRTKL